MKHHIMKNITRFSSLLLLALAMTFIVGCSDQEDVMRPAPPTADDLSFTFEVDADNPNIYHFTGQKNVETWYEHWNFDDGTGAEGLETTKVFFKAGQYEVRFKIFTEGGSASVVQTIVVEQDFSGPDLIKNGGFDGEDFWTVVEIGGGVTTEISGGKASWQGGGWGNVAIYQAVEVEANTEYEINMNVEGSGMSDSWFEIYIGSVEPVPNMDYNNGGILMALNTWDGCGGEAFSGTLSAIACVGDGGDFSWPNDGVGYFVIKCGGGSLGDTGVTVDDVAVRSF